MRCEPLVENYRMSSDTANIKETLQRCARLKDGKVCQVSLRAKTLYNPMSLMDQLLDPLYVE